MGRAPYNAALGVERRYVMREMVWEQLKRVGIAMTWIAGGGALAMSVFLLSFCTAMKMEMRSSEVMVPDLTSMTRDEAESASAPMGLQLEVVDQRHDPAVSSGRVLQQEPLPGSAVRRGRRVKVVLSLGGKILEVPELVGQPARTVSITLRRQGFFPGDEARIYSYDISEGTVVAQVPPPGSPSVPGERVHRLISLGIPEAVWLMPDLVGRSRAEVERWLKLCGFRLGPVRSVSHTSRRSETVVGQLPLAGYPIRGRDVVQLTVAQ